MGTSLDLTNPTLMLSDATELMCTLGILKDGPFLPSSPLLVLGLFLVHVKYC